MQRSRAEMERIGVDPAGVLIMAPKQFHYNLKVTGLMPAEANILKQELLSIGAEAAVARGVASCAVQETDAIISGTMKQLRLAVEKLRAQCLRLPEIAGSISDALSNIGRTEFQVAGPRGGIKVGPRPLVMGILNVTPDSFSEKGRCFDKGAAVERAFEMRGEGADWIDVGGESTRPGAAPVEAREELKRVIPVVGELADAGLVVSIDTTKSEVAREAVKAGAQIVNDISGLMMDKAMAGVCVEEKAAVVLMHMEGVPQTMRQDITHEDIASLVFAGLCERVKSAVSSGIPFGSIIVDPGIGFGKSREDDLSLIRNLSELKSLGAPILVGPSRKSFIGKTLGLGIDERLHATVSAVTIAVMNGANILRVHDVKEAVQAVAMAWAVMSEG